jgi:hypothetical protein
VSGLHAHDALIVPPRLTVDRTAFGPEPFSAAELSAMRRHVELAGELARCRYFTEQERSMKVTMDKGVTTSWEQTLPDRGSTRDMLGVLRQLFEGPKGRASFLAMVELLRSHADPQSTAGQQLLAAMHFYDRARQGVLDSWDAQPGGTEHGPTTPLETFLDWLYGEFLHSDAEKAARIEELDQFQMYEWQFHWVSERLAILYANFARIVESALAAAPATD